MKQIKFSDGKAVSALGQGTYHMGETRTQRAAEVAALQLGIDLGMTLIDTAEMYGEGGAEEVVGEAMQGRREKIFVVTKVYPKNASRHGLPEACARSLRRLRIETIDLYLLHWRGSTPLAETVEAFEKLKAEGKIRRWGVSNFDVDDLEEMNRSECASNQVLYNLEERGIEFDLLPWCKERQIPVMSYSPVGRGRELLEDETLQELALKHEATPAQIALAWVLRQPGVITIPKAVQPEHVRENAAAGKLRLTSDDLRLLDRKFTPPNEKRSLASA